jgi:hypothetical protein
VACLPPCQQPWCQGFSASCLDASAQVSAGNAAIAPAAVYGHGVRPAACSIYHVCLPNCQPLCAAQPNLHFKYLVCFILF